MSTATLTNLRDYLYGTLSPANMLWLATELTKRAKKDEEERLRPYTMEEINAMIAQSEGEIAAGRVIDDDDAWDELDDEFVCEEQQKVELAEQYES